MASKVILVMLGLTIIAVAYGAYIETEEGELETADLPTYEELEEHFEMEKRGRGAKVGPCKLPNGNRCALCNLKVKNKMDRKRYIACKSAGNNKKI